jgi:hypothetical protein
MHGLIYNAVAKSYSTQLQIEKNRGCCRQTLRSKRLQSPNHILNTYFLKNCRNFFSAVCSTESSYYYTVAISKKGFARRTVQFSQSKLIVNVDLNYGICQQIELEHCLLADRTKEHCLLAIPSLNRQLVRRPLTSLRNN